MPLLVGVVLIGFALVPGQTAATGEASTHTSVDAEAGYRQESSGFRENPRVSRGAVSLDCRTQSPTDTEPGNVTECEREASLQVEIPARPPIRRCPQCTEPPIPFASVQANASTAAGQAACTTEDLAQPCEADTVADPDPTSATTH